MKRTAELVSILYGFITMNSPFHIIHSHLIPFSNKNIDYGCFNHWSKGEELQNRGKNQKVSPVQLQDREPHYSTDISSAITSFEATQVHCNVAIHHVFCFANKKFCFKWPAQQPGSQVFKTEANCD